jgi:hypothetical protein
MPIRMKHAASKMRPFEASLSTSAASFGNPLGARMSDHEREGSWRCVALRLPARQSQGGNIRVRLRTFLF